MAPCAAVGGRAGWRRGSRARRRRPSIRDSVRRPPGPSRAMRPGRTGAGALTMHRVRRAVMADRVAHLRADPVRFPLMGEKNSCWTASGRPQPAASSASSTAGSTAPGVRSRRGMSWRGDVVRCRHGMLPERRARYRWARVRLQLRSSRRGVAVASVLPELYALGLSPAAWTARDGRVRVRTPACAIPPATHRRMLSNEHIADRNFLQNRMKACITELL